MHADAVLPPASSTEFALSSGSPSAPLAFHQLADRLQASPLRRKARHRESTPQQLLRRAPR